MSTVGAVVVFTFWAMFFTCLSLKHFFLDSEDAVSKRLRHLVRAPAQDRNVSRGLLVSESAQENSSVKQMRERLLLVGLRRRSDLEKFVLFQKVCYAAPVIVSIVLYFFLHLPVNAVLMSGLASAFAFVFIPQIWLVSARAKRRREMRRHLPHTLDFFVVALEAGLSFDSALVRVGEEQRRVSTQISREFLYTNQEILVGKSREEALGALAKRCGVDEISSFVRAVLQSNKLGNSLVNTLRVQAESLRKKRRQEVQAQILKAPVKLIFPMLFFIFPTLLIVILGPSLAQIFRHLNVAGVS